MHPAVAECAVHIALFGTQALSNPHGPKAWALAGVRSVRSSLSAMIIGPNNTQSGNDRWVWMSVRVLKTSKKFTIMDFTTYDSDGGIASFTEEARLVPLKPQPLPASIYEIQWIKSPGKEGSMPSSKDVSSRMGSVAVAELPGGPDTSTMTVSSAIRTRLVAAGLDCTSVDLSKLTTNEGGLFLPEQWSEKNIFVVPVLGRLGVEAMLCHVIAILRNAAVEARKRASNIRVLIVSAGSEGPALDPDNVRHMGSGSVWGLARTARLELGCWCTPNLSGH